MATKTITLTTDDDEEVELMVIEQTMINNVNYLLVTILRKTKQMLIF